MFTKYLFERLGLGEPYHGGRIRDTRSVIEGLSWGEGISDVFIPEGLDDGFKAHNPCHDIAMDVMRIQQLARAKMD